MAVISSLAMTSQPLEKFDTKDNFWQLVFCRQKIFQHNCWRHYFIMPKSLNLKGKRECPCFFLDSSSFMRVESLYEITLSLFSSQECLQFLSFLDTHFWKSGFIFIAQGVHFYEVWGKGTGISFCIKIAESSTQYSA